MKKVLFMLFAFYSLTFAQNNQTIPSDPFEQMDKIFQMQMKQMQQMQKEMDKMFSTMQQSSFGSKSMPVIINRSSIVSSGIEDKGEYYQVVINRSGNGDIKLDVKAKGNILNISVKETQKIDKNSSFGVVKSFSSSSYTQSYTLPKDADANKIDYDMKENKIVVKISKKK